jgi:hypothetical protein
LVVHLDRSAMLAHNVFRANCDSEGSAGDGSLHYVVYVGVWFRLVWVVVVGGGGGGVWRSVMVHGRQWWCVVVITVEVGVGVLRCVVIGVVEWWWC